MGSIICKPNPCPPAPLIPCSKVLVCINKNLNDVIDGDAPGMPNFCNATITCTTSYLKTLDGYSEAGVRYLAWIDNALQWFTSTSAYSDQQAINAVGNTLSSEFTFDNLTPLISINQIDWSRIINVPPIGTGSVTSVAVTSADVTIAGSPITTSGTITLTLPNVNANVGTFNTLTVNAKGQVTAASNIAVSSNISQSVQSGDGLVLDFNIAHGLVGTPKAHVTAASLDSSGISYITTDSTNIIVHYNVAPATGTNNLIFNWTANL